MPFQARVVGMEMQRAEAQAKRLLRLNRDVLVPEEDHAVVDQRVVHLGKLVRVEIVTEVDALDHGADSGCEAVDGDVAGHDSSRAVFIGI